MLIVTSDILQEFDISFFDIAIFSNEHTKYILPAAMEGGVFSDTNELISALTQTWEQILYTSFF